MLEPLVEGGGCIAGLALLYYFEVWRPAHRAVPPPNRHSAEETRDERADRPPDESRQP